MSQSMLAGATRNGHRSASDFYPTTEVLTNLAREAWRTSDRCVGRSGWASLRVRDCTHLLDPEEIFADFEEHLRYTTNGGRIRPLVTVYARPDVRIRSEQLIRYAGDPQYAGYADTCRRLGWTPTGDRFEVLPVLFKVGSTVYMRRLDPSVIMEAQIAHPTIPGFADLGLRWHAVPAISNMLMRHRHFGTDRYWPVVLNGWYQTDEVAARDLADPERFNVLPEVAAVMGLATNDPADPLWEDLALTELHRAVVWSFRQAGVMYSTPQREARRFCAHIRREHEQGRTVPTDPTWMPPATNPILSATSKIAAHEYDPPEDADTMYVHIPLFHRIGREGWVDLSPVARYG